MRGALDGGWDSHQNSKHLLVVIDPQLSVLLDFELTRKDFGPSLLQDKPEVEGAHGSEPVAKVSRDLVAFLLHPWVNEPSLLEYARSPFPLLG